MIKHIMYILIRMREKMGKTMLSRRGSRRCDGCCRWDSPTFFSMLIYYHYFLCWAGVSIYLATSERKNFSAVHPFLHFFLFAMNNLLDLKRVMNGSKYWRRSTLGGISFGRILKFDPCVLPKSPSWAAVKPISSRYFRIKTETVPSIMRLLVMSRL